MAKVVACHILMSQGKRGSGFLGGGRWEHKKIKSKAAKRGWNPVSQLIK